MLKKFGFRFGTGGVHTSRTMMLDELYNLLEFVDNDLAEKDKYISAIVEENCLGKRSANTRQITATKLSLLYALDPNVTIFQSLLYFWNKDEEGRPLLALLCAYSRDPILRLSLPFITSFNEGEWIRREELEHFIEQKEPERFTRVTLASTAKNINSTWTQSGHLIGRVKKIRSRAKATSGAISYALLLGYLTGVRGKLLFETDYIKLLDCSIEKAIEMAEDASRRGWITFKRLGDIIEVRFPDFLTKDEMGWKYEYE